MLRADRGDLSWSKEHIVAAYYEEGFLLFYELTVGEHFDFVRGSRAWEICSSSEAPFQLEKGEPATGRALSRDISLTARRANGVSVGDAPSNSLLKKVLSIEELSLLPLADLPPPVITDIDQCQPPENR